MDPIDIYRDIFLEPSEESNFSEGATLWEDESGEDEVDAEEKIAQLIEIQSEKIGKRKRADLWKRPDVICKNPKGKDKLSNLEAFYGINQTLDFYHDIFHRSSYDNCGSNIYYRLDIEEFEHNAFWNKTLKEIRYGVGDGIHLNPPSHDLTITAHELFHGVTHSMARLQGGGESGALDESYADVFSSMVKQYVKEEKASEADWLIGDVFVKKGALRSLANPGRALRNHPILGNDRQVSRMSDFYILPVSRFSDSGGIHLNAGIPSHAFYLVAQDLGGHSWEKAGQIWYKTLPKLHRAATFTEFAQKTVKTAEVLYGLESYESKAVRNAWIKVEVLGCNYFK